MTLVRYLAEGTFDAARELETLHGHSFVVRVEAPESDVGMMSAEQFVKQLQKAVSPLDHGFVNEYISHPTNRQIAAWIQQQGQLPSSACITVEAPVNTAIELQPDGTVFLLRRYRFEAAHQLPNVPEGHQCGRMHGHGFVVTLRVKQTAGVSVQDIDRCWQVLYQQLNHNCLNKIPGLENPTSEVLAAWLWRKLVSGLLSLTRVSVTETVTAGCHYDGQNYQIWKDRRFESAIRYPESGLLYGHSYLLRLYLSAPLDPVMGWTIDYGDVKRLFQPVYQALDHQQLDALDGFDRSNLLSLARWVKGQTRLVLPQVSRLDLYSTPGCGVCC
jgi:6-pyruvoyltetrahydropterin/6-carboxytetrahydropterin synthase